MRSLLNKTLVTTLLALSSSILPLQAQETEKNIMVVFDGSGSMWGQINGRTKIEIARETLSQVLSETTSNMNLGMIAYGHRKKGQCADIETVVRAAPANLSVPAMISAANAIKPKGKTPLSDAVRIAAEELKYTENEATVVLVTDGIETCNANPCALANELESAGINFTTHVVGFGLSRDEGRQVACLAENTGGKYFSADDADGLKDALQETFAALPDDDDFEDAVITRNIRFILRDTPDGDQIGIRELSGSIQKADGSPLENDNFQFAYPEANGNSATASLEPGDYVATLDRKSSTTGAGYTFDLSFTVPEGSGVHVIEESLAATLVINPMINPKLRYNKGDTFLTAVGGSRPRFNYRVFAIENGSVSKIPLVELVSDSHPVIPLPPGKYLVQGNIDSGTSVERVIELVAGQQNQIDFSFDATRVYVEKRGKNGKLISNKSAYFYDGAPYDVKGWVKGYVKSSSKEYPFYLPTGTWGLFVGGAQKMITVPGNYRDLYITINEDDQISDKDREFLISRPDSCVELLKVRYQGCLLEKASLQADTTALDKQPSSNNSGSNTVDKQNDTKDNAQATPLPFKQEFAAFSGVFASIGFESEVSETDLAPLCVSKPVLLTENGILTFKRLQSDQYVTDETRFCSKDPSGEIDCHIVPVSEDGKRADVENINTAEPMISLKNYDPVKGVAESCLAGPDGREGPRLCTNIQVCTNAAFQTVGRDVITSLFDAPRNLEN